MLKKMVDGEEIGHSEGEEKNLCTFWALNEKYPEFSGHCGFDGVNPPFHDMEECKKKCIDLTNKRINKKIDKLNERIEIAREEKDKKLEDKLLEERKSLRKQLDPEVGHCKTVGELYRILPKEDS